MNTMKTSNTAPAPHACAHCSGPIPTERRADAMYCDRNCQRRASYHRKSPEERAEYNRRSNARRFKQDLLPRIRLLSKMPAEFTPGSEDARFAVRAFLVMAMMDWKIQHAIQFKAARDALAVMAGGHDALEAIEEEANEYALAKTERIINEAAAA